MFATPQTYRSMLGRGTGRIDGHRKGWLSQKTINRFPRRNFRIEAACPFSGSQLPKVLCFLRHLNIAGNPRFVYNAIQSAYLVTSELAAWKELQTKLFKELKAKQIVLDGDDPVDSQGDSAKYAFYTLMDLERNKILDTQLI